ncbi:MAG TPA: hypothetical protein VF166_14325 [Gemmatimonadaceae bacterium]
MRALALLLASSLLAGCYINVPIGTAVPDDGTTLTVRLTDTGADTLARLIGPAVSTVQGRVLSAGQDSMVLAVQSVQLRSGVQQQWNGERVVLPRPTIAVVSERRLSRWRTALLTGLGMAGSVALVTSLSGGTNEGRPGGGGAGGRQ